MEYIVPNRKRLPYGMMNFAVIRREDYYYVDKTRFIPMIAIKYTNFVFVEKGIPMAGEKIKGLNNAIFHPISLLEDWHSQTTYWSLGVLGSPYKIMFVQRASPINGSDQFRGLS